MLLFFDKIAIGFFLLAESKSEPGGTSEHQLAVLFAQIVLMLLVGRLLGELMHRLGQPAVMGQLLAGVLLGMSVLGKFAPHLYRELFPNSPEQKRMLDAIAQTGVLMLLLLTGMETDLRLIQRVRRMAFFSSIGGIVLPFTCGFLIGEFLPASMLPDPQKKLATSLFLATALSISSVKIVAMVLMEVGFLRRNVGQVILASAILDDTIGWIIISIIGAIASQGAINLGHLGFSVLGTIIFLAFSFTTGKRVVAYIIRWTNDRLTIEMPVITAILILMLLASLLTDYIGVHTVLGAFIVGVLIGQSPFLTRHIEEQLRGLIVAFFAPIFFAVAGLSIDLTVLGNPYFIKLALGLIAIASFGKIVGCYAGGRVGGLSGRESFALAIGMNARGSTEVIVATIGLSLGVLTRDIFTLIVVMAITTTMITPPLLRWALARIPPTGEERERLEKEKAEAKDFVPHVERLLIAVDKSENGKLASILAGMFTGTRHVLSTVIELKRTHETPQVFDEKPSEIVKTTAEMATAKQSVGGSGQAPAPLVKSDTKPWAESYAPAILSEAQKGYDMIFLGTERAVIKQLDGGIVFHATLQELVKNFEGATAVAIARGIRSFDAFRRSLNILVPVTGTDYSRRAAEVAIAIARAGEANLTALHVSPPVSELELIRHPREEFNAGRALVKNIKILGEREGVMVKTRVKIRQAPEKAILRQIERYRHNLVILGVKERAGGERLFFGHRVTALLERTPCSLLLVTS
jgi:Kef-type K+ transport system membrane component KefB/nucleotide-binding universal stress UspA family protein